MDKVSSVVRSAFVRALLGGILLVHVILLVQGYVSLYGRTDGYTLANGEVVGGDFVAFYQAGHEVRSGPERLYDWECFARSQQEYFRAHGIHAGMLVFAYPPLVAFLFGTLSRFSLLQAYLIWAGLSLATFFACVSMLLRAVSANWKTITLACAGALAFYVLSISALAAGQTSAIGALVFCSVFVLLARGRDFSAGLMLALSYYKPPLFLGIVLVLLFARCWRVVAGFALGAVILVGATILSVGSATFAFYLAQASRYRYGEALVAGASLPIEKGVGLLAAIESLGVLTGRTAQLVLLGLTLVGASFLAKPWRAAFDRTRTDAGAAATEELLVTFTLLVSFSLLASLQMVVYDLSILYPFGAASMYVMLKRGYGGTAAAALLLATIGLYYEFAVRSLHVGPVVVKGTTLLWLTWSVSLAVLAGRMRREHCGPGPAVPCSPTAARA